MIDTIYIFQPKDPTVDTFPHNVTQVIACPYCGSDELEYFNDGKTDRAICCGCGYEDHKHKFIKP